MKKVIETIKNLSTINKRSNIFVEISNERDYQDGKWGKENDDRNTPNDWIAYITAWTGKAYKYPSCKDNFRKNMVKVAAIAVAAVEACDRNDGIPPNTLDK
jgi:hypothetical protein